MSKGITWEGGPFCSPPAVGGQGRCGLHELVSQDEMLLRLNATQNPVKLPTIAFQEGFSQPAAGFQREQPLKPGSVFLHVHRRAHPPICTEKTPLIPWTSSFCAPEKSKLLLKEVKSKKWLFAHSCVKKVYIPGNPIFRLMFLKLQKC